MTGALLTIPTSAQAALDPTNIDITPIAWEVIGLDSNKPYPPDSDGPNLYEIGARVCNTSGSGPKTYRATFVWNGVGLADPAVSNPASAPYGPFDMDGDTLYDDLPSSINNWVHIQTGTDPTQTVSLANNECFDFYFNIEIERGTSATHTGWFWTRPFQILAQYCPAACAAITDSDAGAPIAPTTTDPYNITPTARQIYVEKILSQNRNYVAHTNGGACPLCGLYKAGFTDTDGPGGGNPAQGVGGACPASPGSSGLTGYTYLITCYPIASPQPLVVGSTYDFTLIASTATGGYGSWSSQINWPRGIFQIMKVRTQLQATPSPVNPIGCCYEDVDPYTYPNVVPPAQPAIDPPVPPNCVGGGGSLAYPGTFGCNGVIATTYANAGGFCKYTTGCTNPVDPVSQGCPDTIVYRALDPCAGNQDTAGNLVYITFTLKIIKQGGASTSAVVWDGSGSSYHYNGDFADPQNFYTFCATATGTGTCTTAVDFESASATATPAGATLRWKTGSETDNLGFNVYAQNGDRKAQLNDGLIAGSALTAGHSGMGSGASYRWSDPGRPDAYWIEAVDLDGTSEWHGPVRVRGWSASSRGSSPELAQLASADAPRSGGRLARVAAPSAAPKEPAAVAAGGAKIGIDREGWYRIPLTSLSAKGVNVANPSRLRLYSGGVEQPMMVRDGAVEFYGLGLDTLQTNRRVYWLVPGSVGGKRIARVGSATGSPAPDSFEAVAERRDRFVYFSFLRNGEASNYFGAPVGGSPISQTVTVAHPAGTTGTLEVALRGFSAGSHDVAVSLNDVPVGAVRFADREQGVLSVPVGNLVEGTNVVKLVSSRSSDVSLVESIRVAYPHSYVADADAFRFTAPGGSEFTVSGFSSQGVRVVDVTDPAAPTELTVATSPDGSGGFAAASTAPGTGQRVLYAFASGATPPSVVATTASHSLAKSPKAEMLIITGEGLDGSAKPLEAFHDARRLPTRIIPIEQIYDQFSHGEESPQALKDFLVYAASKWTTPPRYILFVGDGSLDPRGYQGPRGAAADVIPTKLVDTQYEEVASDAWFSDLDGDLHPDLALGRLPVQTPAEAEAMVAKIVDYASAPVSGDSVQAAGAQQRGDTFSFLSAAREMATMTPAGGVGTVVDATQAGAKADLLAAMNDGPSVVGYFGHGNADVWGGGFLNAADAIALTNAEHPFFFAPMTCYNAYFAAAKLDSLSEAMLKSKGGAVAAYASSGQTTPEPQKMLADALYAELASSTTPVIGDAIVNSAGTLPADSAGARDVLLTWTLLGDPAMRLR